MATIIDALVVQLGLDASKFHQEAKETKKESDEMKEKFQGLIESALGFFAVIASGRELMGFVNETAEADRETGRLAKTLKIGVGELEAWQNAALMADGTAEGFRGSIKALAGNLVDIEKGLPRAERSLKIFQAAGVQGLAKGKHVEVLDVLDQLAEKMERMDAFEAQRLGSRMGLDDGTVRLLRQGKDGIAEVRKEMAALGTASQADVDAAEELEDAQKKLKISQTAVGRNIMAIMVPALTWLAEKLIVVSKWAKEHSAVVKATFIGLAAGIAAAGVAALIAAPPIIALTSPILLTALAVGALAAGVAWVALEFKKWSEGGQSVLGGLFARFKAVWEGIRGTVMTVIVTIKEIVMTFFRLFADQWELVAAIFSGNGERIKAAFKQLCQDIGHFFSQAALLLIYMLLKAFFMIEKAAARMWKSVKDGAMAALGWIADKLKSIGNIVLRVATLGAVGLGPQAAPAATAALHPAAFTARPSTHTSTRTTTIGQITVQTQATDAQGIARDLPGAIQQRGGLVDQADGGF